MEGNNQNPNNVPDTRSAEQGLDASALFGSNRHLAFIFKKTEKLVAAVYLITDLIKDSEPLKWKVRQSAVDLLSLNLALSTASHAERKGMVQEYRSLAAEIVSLSSVARHAGLVSEMNFQVLSREFSSVAASFDSDQHKRSIEDAVLLDPGFFATGEAPAGTADASKGQSSRTQSLAPHIAETARPDGYLPLKEIRSDQRPKPAKELAAKDDKESRRSVILKLLSKKSGLNVKDFAAAIKGVSEKTIQRELLAMVAIGLLKKEGERRWSTYSLA